MHVLPVLSWGNAPGYSRNILSYVGRFTARWLGHASSAAVTACGLPGLLLLLPSGCPPVRPLVPAVRPSPAGQFLDVATVHIPKVVFHHFFIVSFLNPCLEVEKRGLAIGSFSPLGSHPISMFMILPLFELAWHAGSSPEASPLDVRASDPAVRISFFEVPAPGPLDRSQRP